MSELKNIFGDFYHKFVMRDFFARIIPGSIVLLSITMTIKPLPSIGNYARGMSSWQWIFVGGVSWLLSFAIMEFGRRCYLIKLRYKNIEEKDWGLMKMKFNKCASQYEKEMEERHLVVKEASGIGYVAISFSTIFVLFTKPNNEIYNKIYSSDSALGVIIVVILSLLLLHLRQVKSQYDWVKKRLDLEDVRTWYDKGIEYMLLGNHNEAIDSFNKALKIYPDYTEALAARTEAEDQLKKTGAGTT